MLRVYTVCVSCAGTVVCSKLPVDFIGASPEDERREGEENEEDELLEPEVDSRAIRQTDKWTRQI